MFIVSRNGCMTVRSHMGKWFPKFYCTNILVYLIWTTNKIILVKKKGRIFARIFCFTLLSICTFCWFNSIYTFSHGYISSNRPPRKSGWILTNTETYNFSSRPQKCQKALELSKTLSFVLSSSPPRKGFSLFQQLLTKLWDVCQFQHKWAAATAAQLKLWVKTQFILFIAPLPLGLLEKVATAKAFFCQSCLSPLAPSKARHKNTQVMLKFTT